MKYKFCPHCGEELILVNCYDEGPVPFCPNDKIKFFNTPKPCIVVAVVKDDNILLLKQSYIFKNSKVLVSGYVTSGETVEETVYREVKEETGITVENITYLGSDYLPKKDLLMLTFVAQYKDGEIVKSDEVEGVEWENINTALSKMEEDVIGTAVVQKILDQDFN